MADDANRIPGDAVEQRIDRDAIQKRVDAATAGPWVTGDGFLKPPATATQLVRYGASVEQRHRDAVFIAHARTDVPALLQELAAVEGERDNARNLAAGRGEALQRVRDLHQPAQPDVNVAEPGMPPFRGGCDCGDEDWPCPTIVAIDGEPESEAKP